MGGESNEGEGAPERGSQDPKTITPDHGEPAQALETNPWGTVDAQPVIPTTVAPQHTASDASTALFASGGTEGGGRTGDPSARDRQPPQAVPAVDLLQGSPSQAIPPPTGNENNPFLKKLAHQGQASEHSSSSPPAGSFGQMSLNEPGINPFGPVASHGTGSSSMYEEPAVSDANPWSIDPSLQPKAQPAPGQPRSVPEGEENLLMWGDQPSSSKEDVSERKKGTDSSTEKMQLAELKEGTSAPEVVPSLRQDEMSEGWNLIDHEPRQEPPPAVWQQTYAGNSAAPGGDQAVPSLPTRTVGREATEMYHIIRIKWQDRTARENPRTSPILVQNANGPCPLLALVNALILTTPADATDTPLAHALYSREQISIDLLLQAVVEELMASPRRPSDAVLPDLTELFGFLKGLDTGMNANPRFVPPGELPAFLEDWLAMLDPSERDICIPGGFEQTREMELYSTFSIPLIHGWLPSPSDVVYESMKRRAESYEEAQHILFQEEELQEKLENPASLGLTPEEQRTYQDILIIKEFLHGSATQLTPIGLEILRKAVPPGAVAILFRNDHFSTLYKHPETHALLMLVSDAEFAGHEGAVWETFNDVTGKSEFLSGDFRPVRVTHSRDGGSARATGAHQQPRSPNHEQEDQDYAMALQLQEEEEEQHRQEQQRRQRERRLSEQYMDPQGRHPPLPSTRVSSVGLRRPGAVAQPRPQPRPQPRTQPRPQPRPQQVRPLVPPPPGARQGADEAPPSYDESANDEPFRPPVGHPSHPDSVPGSTSGSGAPTSAPSPRSYQGAQSSPVTPVVAMGNSWRGQRPVRQSVNRPVERPRIISSGNPSECAVM